MSHVLAARDRFNQVQIDAKAMIDLGRAQYGQSIKEARSELGATQEAIARTLGLSREQVRRYERYYEEYVERYGEEPHND